MEEKGKGRKEGKEGEDMLRKSELKRGRRRNVMRWDAVGRRRREQGERVGRRQ